MHRLFQLHFRERYFYLLILPVTFAIEWTFAMIQDWQTYPRSEWVALIDLCVFMPLLYLAFFSQHLGIKARLIRTLGLAGIGLLLARFIVPEPNQIIIADLAGIRNILIGFVLLFEAWVFYKRMSALYARNANAQILERDFAVPPVISKLLVIEARFCKAVWALLKRK